MLRSAKDIESYTIDATDGSLGTAADFYFDDEAWVIRYLIVDTNWVVRRRVLISPISVIAGHWAEKSLPLSLNRQQIKDSPDIDTAKPVSRQQEMGYLGYYGYGAYWGGGGLWGSAIYPDTLQAGLKPTAISRGSEGHPTDPHLRSVNTVSRYYVHATDGDIGHVDGFLVNEATWAIQYLIVNTSNWWVGHQVLIAPEWIDHVSWAESMVYVDLTREAVKTSPPHNPAALLERDHETALHEHYGRKPYWPAGESISDPQRSVD